MSIMDTVRDEETYDDNPFDEDSEQEHIEVEGPDDDEEVDLDNFKDEEGRVEPEDEKGDLKDDEEEPDDDEEEVKSEEDPKKSGRDLASRIGVLTGQRDSQTTRAEQAEARAAEAEEKLAKMQGVATEASYNHLKGQLDRAQEEMSEAIESGDSKAQTEAMVKITKLATQVSNAEGWIARNKSAPKTERKSGDEQPETTAPKTGKDQFKPEAQQWYEQNQAWFDKPGYEMQSNAVKAIDVTLASTGYSVEKDPEAYFEELDRQLDSQFPKLAEERRGKKAEKKGGAKTASEVKAQNRRGQSLGGADRGGETAGKSTAQAKSKATAEEREAMIRFKLNPNDPKQLKEFRNS